MSNNDLIKELRCLRTHLSPLLTAEKINVLEEAERRLKNSGAVSTVPGPSKKSGLVKTKIRKTKQAIRDKYFYQ